jgi:hypothetical protein
MKNVNGINNGDYKSNIVFIITILYFQYECTNTRIHCPDYQRWSELISFKPYSKPSNMIIVVCCESV